MMGMGKHFGTAAFLDPTSPERGVPVSIVLRGATAGAPVKPILESLAWNQYAPTANEVAGEERSVASFDASLRHRAEAGLPNPRPSRGLTDIPSAAIGRKAALGGLGIDPLSGDRRGFSLLLPFRH
jgi:hypothetical protein